MRVGIWCIGWGGDTSGPDWVAEAAQTAERCGFSTLWAGEHFLYFDEQRSQYPYAEPGSTGGAALGAGGRNKLAVTTDLLDPFISLTWAGAVTDTIRLGTGIALLPLRNPVVLAKQVAALDHLTRGRFLLGAGLGWAEEEYDAIRHSDGPACLADGRERRGHAETFGERRIQHLRRVHQLREGALLPETRQRNGPGLLRRDG